MRRPLVIANWKMNLPEEGISAFVGQIARRLSDSEIDVSIAPPFPFLPVVRDEISRVSRVIALAAQNCSDQPAGALTGEVSAVMLRSVSVASVIIGHSERRQNFGEDDAMIGRKVAAAIDAGLEPVLCVGESLEMRERGEAIESIRRQITGALSGIPDVDHLDLAYEPVWAIGTGNVATPQIVEEAHRAVRAAVARLRPGLSVRILYGGSVAPENCDELTGLEEIDGFLVGGASLESSRFSRICESLRIARNQAR